MGNESVNGELESQDGDGIPEAETDREAKERLLGRLIVGQTIGVAGLSIMVGAGGLLVPGSDLLTLLPLGAIAVVVGLVSYWSVKRGRFRLGSYLFVTGTCVAITVNVAIRGYRDASAIYYLWPIVVAVAVLEAKGGLVVAAGCAAVYLGLAAAQQFGYQSPSLPYDAEGEAFLTVGSRVVMFLLLAYVTWLAGDRLNQALGQAHQAARRYRRLKVSMEQQVAERTRELGHRSAQLQAAAAVARDAAATQGLDALLNRAVNLIRERFGFYHASIFLVDDRGEYAVLRAATGEAGRQMLARGQRLKVGQVGMVGYVTGRGEARIALDVGEDRVQFENPLLPETRSEMALPLRVGERIIGALDVQSQEEAAFDQEDVAVLQTMADQLAVAIENARLLHEMQQTVREYEVASGRYTRESWQEVARGSGRAGGYRYGRLGVEQVAEQPPEARQAWQQGQAVIQTMQPQAGDDGREALTTVAVPMRLRGQVVGVLNLRFEGDPISHETISLIEEIADRLALALENSRLLEETQQRAQRDRLIADITARVRSSMDPDTILQTAVRELGTALGTGRTFVRLGISTQAPEE